MAEEEVLEEAEGVGEHLEEGVEDREEEAAEEVEGVAEVMVEVEEEEAEAACKPEPISFFAISVKLCHEIYSFCSFPD